MTFIQFAQDILKRNNYKLTGPRILVLEILNAAEKPMNAYDIAAVAKGSNGKVDTSTVYRMLEVFKNLGLVHFVREVQGYVRCQDFSCHQLTHCHHQFVCRNCSVVKEVHFADQDFLDALKKQFKQFSVEAHYLELAGLCDTCS